MSDNNSESHKPSEIFSKFYKICYEWLQDHHDTCTNEMFKEVKDLAVYCMNVLNTNTLLNGDETRILFEKLMIAAECISKHDPVLFNKLGEITSLYWIKPNEPNEHDDNNVEHKVTTTTTTTTTTTNASTISTANSIRIYYGYKNFLELSHYCSTWCDIHEDLMSTEIGSNMRELSTLSRELIHGPITEEKMYKLDDFFKSINKNLIRRSLQLFYDINGLICACRQDIQVHMDARDEPPMLEDKNIHEHMMKTENHEADEKSIPQPPKKRAHLDTTTTTTTTTTIEDGKEIDISKQ